MKWSLTVICFISIFACLEAGKTLGPVGKILLNSIFECEDKLSGEEVQLSVVLKTLDAKGNKALFLNLTNKIYIDNSLEININILKWQGSGWTQFYHVKGRLCVEIKSIFGKLWEKFRAQVKPPITNPCSVEPGHYVLENYKASSKDLTIPSIVYGRLRLQLKASKNGKTVLCIMGEGDSQAP